MSIPPNPNLNGDFDLFAFDAYLFDIDGTLLNSRDAVHYHAFHSALRATYGCEVKIDGVPVHGNTDIGILRAVTRNAGIDDATFESKLQSALDLLCDEAERNAHDMRPELCASIADLLEGLRAKGKLMGIVSGNLERVGWRKLQAAGLRDYFSIGAFSDRIETREGIYRLGREQARRILGPNARVCYIGDTPADVHAAKALGEPVVAVATGIFPYDELKALSPDVCVKCCTELLQV